MPFWLAACSTPYPAPPQPQLQRDESGGDSAEVSLVDSAADTGEGDPAADSGAIVDSASANPACTTFADPSQAGTVVDASLNEISGLAASRQNPGVLWVLEDHLAPNEVVAIDLAGNTLGRVVLEGTVNNDWEDVAVGPCGDVDCLFVGEIGDNEHDRSWHGVYRFPEPEVDPRGGLDLAVSAELFEYVFPDGQYDCEAMAILPDGRPVLFTKEYDTDQSTAYSFGAMNSASTSVLTRHGRFATGSGTEGAGAAVTAASVWADGATLLIRTYGHVWEFQLEGPDSEGLDNLATATRVELTTGSERQGESISYDPNSRGFFTVSEDVNPPLWFNDCADGG